MPIMMQNSKVKLMCGESKIAKMYCEGAVIYSSGNVVTYVVRGVSYTQEYEEGESVLSPSVVTPILEGATFLGWSTSPVSASVVASLVMVDEPITLYAVFKYPDAIIDYGGSVFDIQSVVGTLLYDSDTAKYGSYAIDCKIYGGTFSNPSTAFYKDMYIYVGNELVRLLRVTGSDNKGSGDDVGSYAGTGGKRFRLTQSGKPIASFRCDGCVINVPLIQVWDITLLGNKVVG